MKVLVTGGTGFVGSEVVALLLQQGHSVRLFSRRPDPPETWTGKDIEVFQGDLEYPETVVRAMEGIEVFFHIGELKNITKTQAEKNVRLVESITEKLADMRVRRLVFISSITVSGIPEKIPADEETAARVILNDHYTAYKRRCEEILRLKPGMIEYAIIRPAPVYGPGSRYLNRMLGVIEKIGPVGLPFIGNGRNITPLIHVRDLANAVVSAGALPGAAGRIFNITDGLRHTWLDFFSALAEAIHSRVRIIPIPSLLLKLPAIPLDLLSGFFGVSLDPVNYLDYVSQDLLFDNSRAGKLLNWQPVCTLAEGAGEMAADYRNRQS